MSLRTRRILLTLAALTWLAGLAAYPLLESTEGRYASVAWDMAHGGDWITPTFNGTALLTKPPLAYWAGAIALKLLPDSEWAVRLPATLALMLAAWLSAGLACRFGLEGPQARSAGLMSALSPLAMVQGHMTTGDIFLWCGILAVYRGVLAPLPRPRDRILAGLGLAVGFLAKGHMVLFWTILPLGAWALSGAQRWRPVARVFHPVTLLVFLGLAAPWFVVVLRRHPGLLGFWLGEETAGRVMSTSHGRAEPWWYFLPLLPVAMLPWLPELIRGLRRMDRKRALLGFWILVPLIAFSLAGSKRPNYLLPLSTPLALLAASALPVRAGRSLQLRSGVWLVIALAWPFVLGGLHLAPPTRALMHRAQRAETPVACFGVMPSSLVFYNRGPVPVLDFVRDERFAVRPDRAPLPVPSALAHLATGGAILTEPRRFEALGLPKGRQLKIQSQEGGLALVTLVP